MLTAEATLTPRFPETARALRLAFRDGQSLLVDQATTYGFWYELYSGRTGDTITWFIAVPFHQVFGVLLHPDTEQAKKEFRFIAQRVTMQQEGWADQGRLSCPTQSLRCFLEKRRLYHCEGWVSPSGIVCWGSWNGIQKYPELSI